LVWSILNPKIKYKKRGLFSPLPSPFIVNFGANILNVWDLPN